MEGLLTCARSSKFCPDPIPTGGRRPALGMFGLVRGKAYKCGSRYCETKVTNAGSLRALWAPWSLSTRSWVHSSGAQPPGLPLVSLMTISCGIIGYFGLSECFVHQSRSGNFTALPARHTWVMAETSANMETSVRGLRATAIMSASYPAMICPDRGA
jgi:hypothetical protein